MHIGRERNRAGTIAVIFAAMGGLLFAACASNGGGRTSPRSGAQTSAGSAASPPKATSSGVTPSSALPAMVLRRVSAPSSTVGEVAKGRVMVVDLWASWCVACKETTARVRRLGEAYDNSKLVVVGVNVGEPAGVVETALGGPPPFATFLDEQFKFSDALGARDLPTVLVVDQAGRIVHQGRTVDQPLLDAVKGLVNKGANHDENRSSR